MSEHQVFDLSLFFTEQPDSISTTLTIKDSKKYLCREGKLWLVMRVNRVSKDVMIPPKNRYVCIVAY